MVESKGSYTARPYHPDDFSEVTALLASFWKCSVPDARVKFQWKYQASALLGGKTPAFVATTARNEIVGFRGYFPLPFVRADQALTILSPSEALVAPAHRRKGIFTLLLHYSMVDLEADADYFMNFSSNSLSTPGYLKQGWVPLASRDYWRRVHPALLLGKAPATVSSSGKSLRVTRDLEQYIERRLSISGGSRGFVLGGDGLYWNWRLSNPSGNYHFILGEPEGAPCVAAVSLRGRKAYLVDWKCSLDGPSGLNLALALCGRTIRSGLVSFWQMPLSSAEKSVLRGKGYLPLDHVRRWFKRGSGPPEVLLRPVRKDCEISDWSQGGMDLRDPSSWQCLPICNDGL